MADYSGNDLHDLISNEMNSLDDLGTESSSKGPTATVKAARLQALVALDLIVTIDASANTVNKGLSDLGSQLRTFESSLSASIAAYSAAADKSAKNLGAYTKVLAFATIGLVFATVGLCFIELMK